MFYFKSHSINQFHQSLVPFTAPVRIDIAHTGSTMCGKLMCNDVCIYRHSFHSHGTPQDARRVENELLTLITYINEFIEQSIGEGEIAGVIDVENWKEDVT